MPTRKNSKAKFNKSLVVSMVFALGVIVGVMVNSSFIGSALRSFIVPAPSEAHITEPVNTLSANITNPVDGQILRSGESIKIYADVFVNGVSQFAYPMEIYVNGVIICKPGNKGNNRILTALNCDWRAPRVKTSTNFVISVKAVYTTTHVATDSVTVTVNP